MNRCFADTFYFLALLNRRDGDHARVVAFNQGFRRPIITTDWVLTEVADAMAASPQRHAYLGFLQFLRARKDVRIVRASAAWFDHGVALYSARGDKQWSLTDCISFAAMKRYGLKDVLSADHHFEQAGFRLLLK